MSEPERQQLLSISIKELDKDKTEWADVRSWSGVLPFYVSNPVVGIDPGRNFGLTLIYEDKAYIHYGKLHKQKPQWKYGFLAEDYAESWLKNNLPHFVVIEGPAFRAAGGGKMYGEANLGHIRMGFASAFHTKGIETIFIPPASSRKKVMGSAKVKGADVWVMLDHNAAESLLLAIYGATKKGWIR